MLRYAVMYDVIDACSSHRTQFKAHYQMLFRASYKLSNQSPILALNRLQELSSWLSWPSLFSSWSSMAHQSPSHAPCCQLAASGGLASCFLSLQSLSPVWRMLESSEADVFSKPLKADASMNRHKCHSYICTSMRKCMLWGALQVSW